MLKGSGKRPLRVSTAFKSAVVETTCKSKGLRETSQLLAGASTRACDDASHRQLQPSTSFGFKQEHMMKYWLACRQIGETPQHLHITMDATRVASKGVMSISCWTRGHDKAFWLPPQVLGLAVDRDWPTILKNNDFIF